MFEELFTQIKTIKEYLLSMSIENCRFLTIEYCRLLRKCSVLR